MTDFGKRDVPGGGASGGGGVPGGGVPGGGVPGEDRVEQLLRQSLTARAQDVGPSPETWERVSTRIRRGQVLRWSLAGTAAVAAVVMAAVVVPVLLDRNAVDLTPADPGIEPAITEDGDDGTATAGCGGGRHLAAVFARGGEGLEGTIWGLCDDGSQTLLDNERPAGAVDRDPALAWDGRSVVFERVEADGDEVLVHTSVGAGRERVLGGGRAPAFAPDGRLAWVQPVEQGQDRILVGRPFAEPEAEFPVVDGEDGEWFDAHRLAWDSSGETLYAEIGDETTVVYAYDVGALYRSSRRGEVRATRVAEADERERYAAPAAAPSPGGLAAIARCCSGAEGDAFSQAALRVLAGPDWDEPRIEREVRLPAGFDANGRLWAAWAPMGVLRQAGGAAQGAAQGAAGGAAGGSAQGSAEGGAYAWSGGSRPAYLVGDGDGVWVVEPDGRVTRIDEKVQSGATNPALTGEGPGSRPGGVAPEQDGLPHDVGVTRQRVWQAAQARDFAALEVLMAEDFSSSFGGEPGPEGAIAMLREMAERGEDPFALIQRLLATPYGVHEPESDPAWYAWPRAFVRAPVNWTDEDLRTMRDLGATDVQIEQWRQAEGYTGWRLGIDGDGVWRYLIRGD